MNQAKLHQPVMLSTAIEMLDVRRDYWYLDATLGMGGHTQEIIRLGGKVVAFDWDLESIQLTSKRLKSAVKQDKLITIHENFAHLKDKINDLSRQTADHIRGAIFDLGTSIPQLTSIERGFSFQGDGPLDMRMHKERQNVTAADLLAFMSEKQLTQVLVEFGGEQAGRAIAKKIKASSTAISTTKQLVDIVESVVKRHGKLHPATKTFQALRIAVNSELDHLEVALPQALEIILPGGRLVVISFHEGEDRIVKHLFKQWQIENLGQILTKKPMTASTTELAQNPHSRSAKLRVFQKL